ncbi:transcriptional adapter 3-B [Drosophila albomicans]|uniref:Transcriptional adapter 3-B n=1 Tax=Drosophila albomicans TaxID=7291 RepID=A0A6P8XIG4_DROAB|nr:transcriptional adapter 3-B [Drosophila albomicans]
MSTNLKNVKMNHFGGGGGAGFGISAGKLLTNNSNTNGSSSAAGSGGGAGSTTGAAGSSNNNSKQQQQQASAADNDVLAMLSGAIIPLIRSRDVAKQLPTLAAALQHPADDYLAAEDLDAVQLELELMLSNVALRARVLKAEYDSLDKDEKRQDRRKLDRLPPGSPPVNHGLLNGILAGGVAGVGGLAGAGNAGAAGNLGSGIGSPAHGAGNSSKRKLRDEPTGVRKKHSSMTILKQQQQLQGGVAKQLNKNSPMAVHTDDSMDYISLPTTLQQHPQQQHAQQQHAQQQHAHQQQQQLPKVSMPKNDMPNKFWLSIEPYCMPLTNEDLRLIDDLLEQYRGPLVPPVPTLGPHYATVWAQEDMKSLQPGGARQKTANAAGMLKKADGMLQESITGPLTQRLVSALMDESLPSEQAAIGEHSSNSSSNENTHSSSNFRSLALLKHGVGIEQRLKKELVDSGLLDANELAAAAAAHDDVDEVMMEIKRVTAEISTVAQFNSEELKRLRAAASEEIKRIELKRKLDTIDQEILECYKRMLQYRAKRKGHTSEEKQEILRLTNEQRSLAEQLERMQLLGAGGAGVDGKL